MRKHLLKAIACLILFVFSGATGYAQLTGTKTIPGDYATIALAVADLNTIGVGVGGVIFNVVPGYTESVTDPILLTATGTSANPIIFQKGGSGARPVVTRTDAGTVATSTLGGQGDAVFIIQGSDYITFDEIDVSTTASGIEYGYYIRKAGVTDGCKNITVKNAAITMTKGTSAYVVGIYSSNNDATSLVSSATGITVTSTDGRNENITLTGNSINNVFTGILIRGFNHGTAPYDFYDQNLTVGTSGFGNIINNYAGNTASTAYGVYMIYQTSPNVNYNTISNAGGGGTNAMSTLYGIMMSTSSAGGNFVAGNNNITLGQGATSGAQCIYVSSTCTSIDISNNTFSYGTFASTSTSYMIYCSNATTNITVTGNQTSAAILKTGAGEFDGYYNNGSPAGGTALISNNNFSNITLTGASIFNGIRLSTSVSQVGAISNNTISNIIGGTSAMYCIYQGYGAAGSMVNGNSISNITGAGTVYGIYLGSTASTSMDAFGNTISGLNTTGVSAVSGIGNNAGTSTKIYKNIIYNLQANNASGTVSGINLIGGTTTSVYNNMISDIKAPITNSNNAISGINVSGGTNANLYYNTVYLNASSTGAAFGTQAVYASTTPNLDMRNNVLVNISTPVGTGITAAYRRSGTVLTSYLNTSNNNCFYAGVPSATNVIYYDGTNSDQTIAAYKTRVAPRDAASLTENPPFINVAATPYNLHLQTTVPTQCESAGLLIISPFGITDDYDGNTRYGETGYSGTGAAPDLGADEGDFILLDLIPPTINYTLLPNTSSVAARTITATITDPSLVGTGVNQPVLYWAINAGAFTGPVAPSAILGNQYTFSLGAGVVTGDVVTYFFVAQDQAATPNVGSAPDGATVTLNPPLASAPPATPSSYTILGCISGIKTVGTAGDYATLTAAIADLNSKELCGPLTLNLLDASYSASETFPIILNFNTGSSATNFVLIKPAAGVTATISGSVASSPLIKILNNYTSIDGSNAVGGTTRDLTISNTGVTSPQVILIASNGTTAVTDVELKNTIIINGINTSSAVIVSDVAGTAGYFNNITIQNNSIQKAYNGIYVLGTVAIGNGSGLLINGNDLNTSGANALLGNGIYVQGVDGVTVTNNNMGNFTQSAYTFSITGVWFATGTTNGLISGNNISGLYYTGTGAYSPRGIVISTGLPASNITVRNNVISDLTSSGTSQPYGIHVFSTTTGVIIEKNKVSSIVNSNTSGYGARGIHVNTGVASSDINIVNNFVWNIQATSDASSTYWVIGIGIEGATSGVNVYLNSVNLYGSYAGYASATISSAFAVITSTASNLDVRDNIFMNTYDNTGGVADKSYAIYSVAANSAYPEINYNDYFVSGTPAVLGYLGTDQASLAAWQTATAKDANSVSGDPLFLSSTDLHLNTALNSPAKNAGFHIPIIQTATDIDGDNRNDPPDMGADDYSLTPTVVTDAASALTGISATINGTITANNETVAVTFEYGTTLAFGTTVIATPASVSGNTATPVSYNLTGLLPNTTYYFQAKGTIGSFVYNGVPPLSFTTASILADVTTDPATSVTSAGAVINGTVNANNTSTDVSFEYGLTTAYGTTVTAVPSPVAGMTNTAVSYTLSGLVPNSTYHFRVVGTNTAGTANGLDLTFTTQAVLPVVITDPATFVTGTGAILNGTVNANNASTDVSFEYGLTAAYGTIVTAVPSPVTGNINTAVSYTLTGLIPNTTYHYRVVGTNIAGTADGLDITFNTPVILPTVTTDPASSITSTDAVLNGTVNANNDNTVVTFEYGLTSAYGNTVAGVPSPVTGITNTPVSYSLSGLVPNTTYHYRVVGVNTAGTANGLDLTFTTSAILPVVVTDPATLITSATATLNGTVNANNASTTVTFEYGLTVAYGTFVTAVPGTVNGLTNLAVAYLLTGLAPNTTYHFRVVGVNAAGTAVGLDETFTTLTLAPTVVTTAATSIGSNSATLNGIVNANNEAATVSFEYGLTTAYGTSVSAIPPVVAGFSADPVSAPIASLALNTLYHYRAVATNATGTTNGNDMTFTTGCQIPDAAGPIAGLTSICQTSNGVIFSVGTITNAVTYVWSVPAGATIVSGNTTNSITVDFGAAAVSGNVTVYGSGVCGDGTPSSLAITLNPLPVQLITGPTSVCASPSAMQYYYTEPGMNNYQWTVSPGAAIALGGGLSDDFIAVILNVSGPQWVSVSYTNANNCTTATPVVYTVTVNPLPVPTISGLAFVCEGTAGEIYTTESGMTGYTWFVSPGGTITAGGTSTSNTVTVTWNTAGAQNVSVNYVNANSCTAITPSVYSVTVNTLPVPSITGLASVCTGTSGVIYSTEAFMTGYNWTVSSGGTITAGAGTNTITVTWNAFGAQNVYVNYVNANSCTANTPSVYSVTVNPLPVPTITGLASVCTGTSGVIYSTDALMTGYTWTVSSGGTITAGAGTNIITVTWNAVGAQNVYVNYVNANSCTATTPSVYSVTVNPLPVPTITGSSLICGLTTGLIYSTEASMTGYTWTVSSGGTITAGAGTNAITVSWNTFGAQNVYVNYVNANGCTATTPAVKNVAVDPLPVPTITGPASVCIGATGITYTTEASMTGYAWTLSAGGIITAGAGTNAITVTFNTAGTQNVYVNYVNANGCSAAIPSVMSITVNPLPVPTITGSANACAGSTNNSYTTEGGMTGYSWTVSAGGAITAGAGTNAISVTWNTTGTKTVYVNYTNPNGCQAITPATFNVSVTTGSSPTITGPVELCAGSTGVVYTTEPGFSNYVWSISYGGIITSGLNTNQVTVDWGTAGQRYIAVNYENASGCGAVSPYFHYVTVLSVPVPLISGDDIVCQGATGETYTTQPNNTGYVWTVSSGGTITSGVGTNALTVTWNGSGNQTVSVNYTNSAGCDAITPAVFNVVVNPKPAAAGTITGTSPVCAGTQGVVYIVSAIANATSYNWSVPTGATIVSGAATNAITIDFALTATSGIIKVNGVNDCGPGASSPDFNLVVNPIPPTPVITQHGDTLTSSANAGNQWYLDGVIIPGATGKQHIAVYTGNYYVVVTLTGCSSTPSNTLLVLPVSVSDFELSRSFEVYPNPNHGQFNIKVVSANPVELNIEIYNNLGSLLWKQEKVIVDGTYIAPVDIKLVPNGVYKVALRNKNTNIVRKVVILK